MGTMIEDLLKPENLPDPTQGVTLIQTHISLVFVADNYVYKIKKPVNFGFLDFSTLNKRKFYCEKEIELNSRLSEDIYLDLLSITCEQGRYRIEDRPARQVVDYAVKMRRIPENRLMKNLLFQGKLSHEHIKRLAGVLASFHARAETDPEIQSFGRPEKFRINTDENFVQVEPYVGVSIDRKAFELIREWTEHFYKSNSALFYQRIDEGKVKDGHGDLHMEHICFEDHKISIFDCIEFNDRFRYADQVADISFLLMDLDFHGAHRLGHLLWSYYKEAAREGNVEELLMFYKVYRAFVRGKVISFQLDDPQISSEEKEKATNIARKYFDLALSYVRAQ